MKAMKATQARGLRCWRTSSAIVFASWRTEATSAARSWTAPMRTEPSTIHSTHGNHPNWRQALIGPTIGPAAAIALKCWPRRYGAGVGEKSAPSAWVWAGVFPASERPRRRPTKRP